VVTPAAGTVVLVPFPFSDLSQAKLRPAVVLADVGRGDWITQVGTLKAAPFQQIIEAVVALLQTSLRP
jgi:mRNA interferase MazF